MCRDLSWNFLEEDEQEEAEVVHQLVEARAHRVHPPGCHYSVRKNCRTHHLRWRHTAGKSKVDGKVKS